MRGLLTMPETTQSDLVERLRGSRVGEVMDAAKEAAAEITRLRADSERLQMIESQIDGGRFDEWPTETFVGQLRMQSRDSLDPEYSQFMAATANRMESLRAHCEAMAKALERIALSGEGEDVFERSTLYGTFQVIARTALAASRKDAPA